MRPWLGRQERGASLRALPPAQGGSRSAARFTLLAALALFALLALVYGANRSVLLGNDTRPARYTVISLLKRGDVDLDEFTASMLQGRRDLPYFVVRSETGHIVSRFGIGAPAAALPVFAASQLVDDGRWSEREALVLAKLASSLYVAATAAVLFLLALRLSATRRQALVVALVYGLGTTAFSVVAQALWQHGPAQFFLTLGLYLLLDERPLARALAGAAYAAAVVCRPPDAVFAVAATVHVGLVGWRTLPAFLAGAAPLAALQLWFNARHFGAPWTFAQTLRVPGPDTPIDAPYWTSDVLVGLAGQLISPSRGLFVYTPLFLFLLWRPRRTLLALPGAVRAQLAGALLLLLVQAPYYGWYGGWTFGYRMLADAAPVLSLALLPVIAHLGKIGRPLFALAAAASLVIHAAGAWCYTPFTWDAHPDVDKHPERLWSIRDSQLVHVFTHLVPRDPP